MKDAMKKARKKAAESMFDGLLAKHVNAYELDAAIDAFLLALKEEGMVVVKREPTEEMIMEGADVSLKDLTKAWRSGNFTDAQYFLFADSIKSEVRNIYAAMIAASASEGETK